MSAARAPRKQAPARGGRTDAALGALLDDLESVADELAERMLERYLAAIPTYRSMPDETLRQVREVNRRNVRGFIRSMRRLKGPNAEELRFIRESASRRAREGVPLSALLAAYRLGAQLAWAEALVLVHKGDEHRMRAGLDLATALMHWVDQVSGVVAQSYLEEYERLSSDREAARRDFLDGAISGGLTPEELLARAEALGLDVAMPCAVAVVALAQDPVDDSAVRAGQHRLRSMAAELPEAARSLAVVRGSELVIVFPSGDEAGMLAALRAFVERAAEALETPVRAGVGRPRDSLAELAGTYREASLALIASRGAAAGSVGVYGEVLVEELILRERGVARRLAQTVLEPLEAHPELLATLEEYLRSGPSLPSVAKKLFLHPNTVAYRLARVKELTGRDPKTPPGVAELFLALRANELVGPDRG